MWSDKAATARASRSLTKVEIIHHMHKITERHGRAEYECIDDNNELNNSVHCDSKLA